MLIILTATNLKASVVNTQCHTQLSLAFSSAIRGENPLRLKIGAQKVEKLCALCVKN
jgi:hypothetical protein